MPIVFPPSLRGNTFNNIGTFLSKPRGIQVAPILGRPGVKYPANLLFFARPNLQRLGFPYVVQTTIVNPMGTPLTNRRVFNRVLASVNALVASIRRRTGYPDTPILLIRRTE